MRITVEHVRIHSDARGLVFEPLTPGQIPSQQNVHLVVTQPGAIRGNHYHKRGTEVIAVAGPALARFRDGGMTVEDITIAEGQVVRFTIPPGVSHAFRNIGQEPVIMVAFNSVVHVPDEPDVFADILIEN